MNVRRFALIIGALFTLAGVMGLLGIGVTPMTHGPEVAVEAQHGMPLGLFPVNILHNLVHLALGVWGLVTYYRMRGERTYARGLAIIYGVLAVAGLFPGLNTMFGLVPIHGNDIWLHGVTAVAAAIFGWSKVPVRTTRTTPTRTPNRNVGVPV